ncbi:MAG: HD domain-containing protein [Candidatus Paceibacterota bacterium]
MAFTPRIDKALKLATLLHEGQYRKDRVKIPYIAHPVAVMYILKKYTRDEDILIAGLLHDILEDVELPFEEKVTLIEESFGRRVLEIVVAVTEEQGSPEEKNTKKAWEKRKKQYLKSVAEASEEAVLVCAADKIHNLMSLISAYEHEGALIWEKFHAPKGHKLWFYEEVFEIVRNGTRSAIVDEFEHVLDEARNCI